jgi:hypothetical protein
MAAHRILMMADDLTGALEVGAKFAAAGVSRVRCYFLALSLTVLIASMTFRVLQNHGVRNAQQSYAESPQMIFFLGVPAYLVDLRMNAAIKLNGQSVLEAVEIQDAIFNVELTAKRRPQPTTPQEPPRGLFSFRWGPSHFANSRRGDFHGAIISAHRYPPVRDCGGQTPKAGEAESGGVGR